jgi:hypothetical protein
MPQEPILPSEARSLPASLWHGVPLVSEPERPTRFALIVLGVAALFASLIAGAYWFSEQRQAPVAPEEVVLHRAPAKFAPVAEQPIVPASKPPVAPPTVAKSPASSPSPPPTLVVGLPPIGQLPPAAPVEEAPAQPEFSSTPVPPAKPIRKATPAKTASQPSNAIKF